MPTYATTLNDIKNNSLAHCELQDLEQPNKTYDIYLVGNDLMKEIGTGDVDEPGGMGDIVWFGKSFSLIYAIKGSSKYDTYHLNNLFSYERNPYTGDSALDYYHINTTRGFEVVQSKILLISQHTGGSSGQCLTTYAIMNGKLKQIPHLEKNGSLTYRPSMTYIIDYKWGAYIMRKDDWTNITLEAYTYDPQSQQLVWKKTLAVYDGEKQQYIWNS